MIPKMKSVLISTSFFLVSMVNAQMAKKTVPDTDMERVYQEVKTPYKYGMVLVPEDNSKKIDCPTVYRKGKDWFMSYILFDGKGYETYLAKSKDLLHWSSMGKILSYSKDSSSWDAHQRAGYMALQDQTWEGTYALEKYNGKYWMSYIGGKEKGYEAGELSIGVANLSSFPNQAKEWNVLNEPVLRSNDADARWWENKKNTRALLFGIRRKAWVLLLLCIIMPMAIVLMGIKKSGGLKE